MKKRVHDTLATILGLFTSLATAMAVIDFDTFDLKKVNNWIKLFVVCMPAIGGYLSEIKTKKLK